VLGDGLVVVAFLLVVVGVVGGAILAERWTRRRGLELARTRLRESLGAPAVDLSLEDGPLLPALLRRPGAVVEVRAVDVPVADGALLRDLAATIHDVRADLGRQVLTTGRGTFTATIDERELASMVRLPGVVARLELHAEGLRVWTVLGVGVDAVVLVHDGALRVVPDPVQVAPLLRLPGVGAFRRVIEGAGLLLDLPPLPFGARVESVRFTTGSVVATGRLEPQDLPLRRP
jgi:hypothetical protein